MSDLMFHLLYHVDQLKYLIASTNLIRNPTINLPFKGAFNLTSAPINTLRAILAQTMPTFKHKWQVSFPVVFFLADGAFNIRIRVHFIILLY